MDILVVAAHPDDEVLGCGGTIVRHAEAGDRVAIAILADGETSRGDGDVEARYAAAQEAAQVLGAEPPRFLGLPDNRLDSLPILDVVQGIEEIVREIRPGIVYTHHGAITESCVRR